MKNINYQIPTNIAYEMMDCIKEYQDYAYEYVRTYRRYMFLGELKKWWAKDVIEERYSTLEFTWNKICELDGKLESCSNMIGVDRFKFFQVVRILKKIDEDCFTSGEDEIQWFFYDEEVEKILDCLDDWEYNGKCLSPEEIKAYLRTNRWENLKEFIR